MSYSSIVDMANSASLIGRVTACAAQEGIDNPETWTRSNVWKICSSPGWAAAWQFATDNYQVNANPDYGARTDVISDSDVLAAVQAAQAVEPNPT
jgi:hypothetical protein